MVASKSCGGSRKGKTQVVSGNSISNSLTGGSGCWNEAIALSITGAGAGPYDWFDAAQGGNQLGTGSSIDYIAGNPAKVGVNTIYVEERATGINKYTVGHQFLLPNPWAEWSQRAVLLNAHKELTVVSLRTYVRRESGGTVKAQILDSSNTMIAETVSYTVDAVPGASDYSAVDFSFNKTIPAGIYYLTIIEKDGKYDNLIMSPNETIPNNKVPNVFSIFKHQIPINGDASAFVLADTADEGSVHNGQVFDIRIETQAPNPCSRKSVQATVNDCAVGLTESFIASGIELFPNPSTSSFTVNTKDVISGLYTINVFGATGELVSSTSTQDGSIMFGESLKAGIYTVQIIDGTNIYSSKIIKQ